jgi:hypothetical protein
MKLRFKVNQAECLKRGIDAPKSIVTVEVNPAELPIEIRTIIALHMDGIDVCVLGDDNKPAKRPTLEGEQGSGLRPVLIEANEPTLDGLLDALKKNSPVDMTKKAHYTKPQKQAVKKILSTIEDANQLQHDYRQARGEDTVSVQVNEEKRKPRMVNVQVGKP